LRNSISSLEKISELAVFESQNMRVLLITSDPTRWGLAACYQRAFQKRGYDARLHYLFGDRSESLFVRAVSKYRVLHSLKLKNAEKILLTAAREFQPNLIIIAKGAEFDGGFLQQLKSTVDGVLFNIYTDSPFVYPGARGLGEQSFTSAMSSYDCLFTFARFLVPVFYLCGANKVEYLPFAHDPEMHQPTKVRPDEISLYESPIAYMGTWGTIHERWLEMLQPFGLKIWGHHWDHLPFRSDLRGCWQKPGVGVNGFGSNMAKVCGASGIIFNIVRAEHGCAHSMKTFEIPACKGFMLSNRTDEQLEYFQEDRCAVYFSTLEELLDKVKFYLGREDLRDKIASEGYSEAGKHTYSDRLDNVLKIYKELRG